MLAGRGNGSIEVETLIDYYTMPVCCHYSIHHPVSILFFSQQHSCHVSGFFFQHELSSSIQAPPVSFTGTASLRGIFLGSRLHKAFQFFGIGKR
jgi:hypothetical protein